VHPEQTDESVGFVGGVEIIVAVGETTPPKCAHDAVWAFTAKCTGVWYGLKRRDEVDHMCLARAGSVPGHGAQSAQSGPVERRDGSATGVSHQGMG